MGVSIMFKYLTFFDARLEQQSKVLSRSEAKLRYQTQDSTTKIEQQRKFRICHYEEKIYNNYKKFNFFSHKKNDYGLAICDMHFYLFFLIFLKYVAMSKNQLTVVTTIAAKVYPSNVLSLNSLSRSGWRCE
jgi:hypothetical protein